MAVVTVGDRHRSVISLHREDCCVLGDFAEFVLTVEPTDTVVVGDQPLTLDCVAHFTDDEGTHMASIQWLKDSQPFALSPPHMYKPLSLSFISTVTISICYSA